MIRRLDHLGLAVRDLEEAAKRYEGVLGLVRGEVEEVPDQGVRVLFFEIGDTRIELLEPTSPESPMAKFLEKRGPGLHHVAYQVDDLVAALRQAKEAGARLLNETPRRGAHGALVAFLHPSSLDGVLTELCQRA